MSQSPARYWDGAVWREDAMGAPGQTIVMRDGLPTWMTLANGTAVGVQSGPSTASATFSLIPNMSLVLQSNGLPLVCRFDGTFIVAATTLLGDTCEIALFIDGAEVPDTRRNCGITLGLALSVTQVVSCTKVVTGLAIGARTVEVRFRRPGATGAAVCVGTQRSLSCWEVP